MSTLRQLPKGPDCYLVRYLCDEKLQIRGPGFFRTTDEIQVGNEYEIQWGRLHESDVAVVLACGTTKDMRIQMRTHNSSSTENTSAPKKKANNGKSAKPQNPIATVISMTMPPLEIEEEAVQERSPQLAPEEITVQGTEEEAGDDGSPPSSPSPAQSPVRERGTVEEAGNGCSPPSPPLPTQTNVRETETTETGDGCCPPSPAPPTVTPVVETPVLLRKPENFRVGRARDTANMGPLWSFMNSMDTRMNVLTKDTAQLKRQNENLSRTIHQLVSTVNNIQAQSDTLVNMLSKITDVRRSSQQADRVELDQPVLENHSVPEEFVIQEDIIVRLSRSAYVYRDKVVVDLVPETT